MAKLFSISITIYLVFLLSACGTKPEGTQTGNATSDSTNTGILVFQSLEHDFGTISEGEKVGWYFKFTNTGKGPLVINNAHASCGCTVPEYSREPILPGGEGTIRVVFDSSGRSGAQSKQVTVETNAEPYMVVLTLKAEIKENLSN